MRRRPSAVLPLTLLVLALLLLARRANAQQDRFSVPTGTRVRVVVAQAEPPYVGTVLRLGRDTLVLAAGGGSTIVQLPFSRLTWMEASEGRDRLGWSLRGAGIGGLAGGVLGAVTLGRDEPADLGALAGFIAGGVLGVGGGAILGAILAPERWRVLSLRGAR